MRGDGWYGTPPPTPTPHEEVLADVAWNAGARVPLFDRKIVSQADTLHLFSHPLKPRMKATDQLMTGRCWVFAGLALLRRRLAKRYDLSVDFELSASYVLFYDKLEKAHSLLHRLKDARLDERTRHYLLEHHMVPDGGTFASFQALVNKYGIVPAVVMPESRPSSSTQQMNALLRKVLFRATGRLATAKDEWSKEVIIDAAMTVVHRVLRVCIGRPPPVTEPFEWIFPCKASSPEKEEHGMDSASATRSLRLTPSELYAECSISDHVLLTHCPGRSEGVAYVVQHQDTVWPARQRARYHAVDLDTFASAAYHTLKSGDAVWFACEFDQSRLASEGLLHEDLVQTERLLGFREDDKATRVASRAVDLDHAMLITGMHLSDDGRLQRWQVENSHGNWDDREGYLSMSSGWFARHVFVIAVPRRMVSEDVLYFPEHEVPPWDVLGFVAR